MVENTIASQLKRLRKSRGWTQTQLADKLSVSKQTISNWETGTKVPRMGSLQNLADLFHVKIGEITNASIIKEETQSHLPTNIVYPLGNDFERVSIPLSVRLPVGIQSQPKKTLKATLKRFLKSLFQKAISLLYVVRVKVWNQPFMMDRL